LYKGCYVFYILPKSKLPVMHIMYQQMKSICRNNLKKYFFLLITFLFAQHLFAQTPTITSFSPTTAGPGDTVIITGTNLTAVKTVEVGGPVNFQIKSSTEIYAFIAVAGSGNVTLDYEDSNFVTQSVSLPGFTWDGTPIIYSAVPLTAKQGDTVTFTGRHLVMDIFLDPPTITFGGVAAKSVTALSNTVVKAIVGNGASGNISLSACCGSTIYPGFVFEQICTATSITNLTICMSQLPYSWNGKNLFNAASYIDTLKGITGCDSIATLNLIVNAPTTSTTDTIICSSQLPYIWNGLSLSSQGTYNATLVNSAGCDSIAHLTLLVSLCNTSPTITSFSPTSGPVGTTVTITGTNFNTTAANNIVYFGAVKAVVNGATATTLTVTAPVGATYQPITVTTGGLTAYSAQSFDLTFTSGVNMLSANSFAPQKELGTTYPSFATSPADIDGDGKIDLIVSADYPSQMSVYQNTSNNNMISLINKGNYIPNGKYGIQYSQMADLDGDGKQDIVEVGFDSTSIYKNTSTSNNFSFAKAALIVAGNYPSGIVINDFDNDGKPDIILAYEYSTQIAIYKNTSSNGIIAFTLQGVLTTHDQIGTIVQGDLDGDGKPDLVITNTNGDNNVFSVYRNISTNGTIAFDSKQDFASPYPALLKLGDLYGNGKLNLIVGSGENIYVFDNTSIAGTISFNTNKYYTLGTMYSEGFAIGDIDGDSKPDIVVANSDSVNGNSVSVFKNISANGILSFATGFTYPTGRIPRGISICDIDGDNKPDLVVENIGSNFISILRNQIGEPVPTQLCPPLGSTALVSNLTGTNYQWQINTGSGFTSIKNYSDFTGSNDSTQQLQIINIPSNFYGTQIRCIVDGKNSDVYTLKFTDTWTGTTDSTWENTANWSCGTLPDSNTDVIINGGTVVLKSNTTVRSITVSPGANFSVAAGFNLTITH
jgi:hypothetical protein